MQLLHGKTNTPVCWITYQIIKMYRSVEVQIHWFSAPNGGLWLILGPSRFTGTEKCSGVCGHGTVSAIQLILTRWNQKALALPGIKPRHPSSPNHSLIIILTELSRLRSAVHYRIEKSRKKVRRFKFWILLSFYSNTPPPQKKGYNA